MCDEIRLVRQDGDTPWGFRLTGGRDFGTPLLVVKVIGGSIAALAGVHVGDIVRGINYVPTNEFTHLDAQRAILESNDTLVLNLIRGDEEPEEIEKKVENLELSFVVKLNRSGRISAVEEVLSPCSTPLPSQSPGPEKQRRDTKSRSGSGDRSSWSARGSLGAQTQHQVEEEKAKKGKVTLTVMDDGPIIMKPLSSQQQVETKSSQNVTFENMSSNKEITDEVTLHEEMMMETSLKKTTTKITERSEEEFVNEVRGGIVQRARSENRELTEDEIMEMMAGEAEVLDEEKGTIGVNFQKFIPKCEFIKESSVFKALQEEQTKKEKTEVQQLMKDPTKRFSKFLIKPNTPKPLPKPKPVVAEPMAWQKKMENEKLEKKEAAGNKQTAVAEVRSPEGEKTFIHENEKSAFQSTAVEKAEERKLVERREECIVQRYEQHEESIQMEESIDGTTSSFSSSKACAKSSKAYSVSTNNQDDENETENSSSNNRKDSEDSTTCNNNNSSGCKKRSSLSSQSEGRRSKSKKVGFMGVEERANIEKQLEDIQKQLLSLQRLPLEIQNHLLAVQQSLQDIVSQRQSPTSGMDRDDEDYYNENDEDIDKFLKETDDEFETMYKEQEEEGNVTINEEEGEEDEEEEYTAVDSRRQTMEEDEYTDNAGAGEESLIEDQEQEGSQQIEQQSREEQEEPPKQLPHGQEDVEMCRAERKRSFPLTPQLRPMILPGGRKWRQPKDAFNEEFIAETIVSQSEVLVGTTIGVNFRKYIPPKFDSANSAVYKLIHELEEKSKKGVAERPEKVHDLDKYYNPPIDKRHFFAATLYGNQAGNPNNKTQP